VSSDDVLCLASDQLYRTTRRFGEPSAPVPSEADPFALHA
jgi:hypothetical protein